MAGFLQAVLPPQCGNVAKQRFADGSFYGMLVRMGSKDKGRKETKKAPKPKPKPEPGRKREIFTPPPPK